MVHQLEFGKQDRYDLTMHPYTLVLVTSLTHTHTVETQFIDYQFLKDLELRKEPKCCCGQELLIFTDDKVAK